MRPLAFKRRFVDIVIRRLVGFGGAAVITTIALIFFYLLWVAAPMLKSPAITELAPAEVLVSRPEAPGERALRALGIDDRVEYIFVLSGDNRVRFLRPQDAIPGVTHVLGDAPLEIARRVFQAEDTYALLDKKGDLRFVRLHARTSYEGAAPEVSPTSERLFGDDPLHLGEARDFDAYWRQGDLYIVRLTVDGAIELIEFEAVEEDDPPLEVRRQVAEVGSEDTLEMVRIGPRGRLVYALDSAAGMHVLRALGGSGMTHLGVWPLVSEGVEVNALAPLSGRYSWLVADNQGLVRQWTLAREGMLPVRAFAFEAPVTHLAAEDRRKGAMAVDAGGGVHLIHTTSGRAHALHKLDDPDDIAEVAISPRGDLGLVLAEGGALRRLAFDNEHPEISWSSLWRKTWYEGYPEASFTWQSSASESDFEPKFSLVPLLLGTFKAAFYAMLIATPIAVFGAIYTAYFMAPAMRKLIKPGVEIMASMPTVVLGFLAGLWLAPLIESHLSATLLAFFALPLAVLLMSRLASLLQEKYSRLAEPWLGVLCVPLIVMVVWLLFRYDAALESFLFAGDAKYWFRTSLGLDYDQRNALVVGIAMGIAVVPIIFAISEDAVHGVPRHLTSGSLALGATPWQTLAKLVVPFASPGIFSALMIGFGRAVGETMIVLMATGNTPLVNMNLFEGMRTFAANIAVELPESEVGSSHFRLLFLTALVLFVMTFAFNTIAEIVRARLRKRYASL